MALSKQARKKGEAKAAELLPAGTQVRAYAIGRGHARATTGAIIAGTIFVVVFVIGLLLGYILIPGVLLALYVIYEVRPPRAVVVSNQGLAIMARSFWNGRPSKVLAQLPLGPLYSPTTTGSVTLALGPERITLPRREYDIAANAATLPPG